MRMRFLEILFASVLLTVVPLGNPGGGVALAASQLKGFAPSDKKLEEQLVVLLGMVINNESDGKGTQSFGPGVGPLALAISSLFSLINFKYNHLVNKEIFRLESGLEEIDKLLAKLLYKLLDTVLGGLLGGARDVRNLIMQPGCAYSGNWLASLVTGLVQALYSPEVKKLMAGGADEYISLVMGLVQALYSPKIKKVMAGGADEYISAITPQTSGDILDSGDSEKWTPEIIDHAAGITESLAKDVSNILGLVIQAIWVLGDHYRTFVEAYIPHGSDLQNMVLDSFRNQLEGGLPTSYSYLSPFETDEPYRRYPLRSVSHIVTSSGIVLTKGRGGSIVFVMLKLLENIVTNEEILVDGKVPESGKIKFSETLLAPLAKAFRNVFMILWEELGPAADAGERVVEGTSLLARLRGLGEMLVYSWSRPTTSEMSLILLESSEIASVLLVSGASSSRNLYLAIETALKIYRTFAGLAVRHSYNVYSFDWITRVLGLLSDALSGVLVGKGKVKVASSSGVSPMSFQIRGDSGIMMLSFYEELITARTIVFLGNIVATMKNRSAISVNYDLTIFSQLIPTFAVRFGSLLSVLARELLPKLAAGEGKFVSDLPERFQKIGEMVMFGRYDLPSKGLELLVLEAASLVRDLMSSGLKNPDVLARDFHNVVSGYLFLATILGLEKSWIPLEMLALACSSLSGRVAVGEKIARKIKITDSGACLGLGPILMNGGGRLVLILRFLKKIAFAKNKEEALNEQIALLGEMLEVIFIISFSNMNHPREGVSTSMEQSYRIIHRLSYLEEMLISGSLEPDLLELMFLVENISDISLDLLAPGGMHTTSSLRIMTMAMLGAYYSFIRVLGQDQEVEKIFERICALGALPSGWEIKSLGKKDMYSVSSKIPGSGGSAGPGAAEDSLAGWPRYVGALRDSLRATGGARGPGVLSPGLVIYFASMQLATAEALTKLMSQRELLSKLYPYGSPGNNCEAVVMALDNEFRSLEDSIDHSLRDRENSPDGRRFMNIMLSFSHIVISLREIVEILQDLIQDDTRITIAGQVKSTLFDASGSLLSDIANMICNSYVEFFRLYRDELGTLDTGPKWLEDALPILELRFYRVKFVFGHYNSRVLWTLAAIVTDHINRNGPANSPEMPKMLVSTDVPEEYSDCPVGSLINYISSRKIANLGRILDMAVSRLTSGDSSERIRGNLIEFNRVMRLLDSGGQTPSGLSHRDLASWLNGFSPLAIALAIEWLYDGNAIGILGDPKNYRDFIEICLGGVFEYLANRSAGLTRSTSSSSSLGSPSRFENPEYLSELLLALARGIRKKIGSPGNGDDLILTFVWEASDLVGSLLLLIVTVGVNLEAATEGNPVAGDRALKLSVTFGSYLAGVIVGMLDFDSSFSLLSPFFSAVAKSISPADSPMLKLANGYYGLLRKISQPGNVVVPDWLEKMVGNPGRKVEEREIEEERKGKEEEDKAREEKEREIEEENERKEKKEKKEAEIKNIRSERKKGKKEGKEKEEKEREIEEENERKEKKEKKEAEIKNIRGEREKEE
ncbi:MAG: hypothetical protein LBU15_03880 [Rickettsiales bacterium]|jgi:hypothetical protein|nr:hypothetical protein [Rickettsiales bacterium]